MTTQYLTAPVKWAQRKDSLYITIDLPDVIPESAKIELSDKKLEFTGTSHDQEYKLQLEFLHEIDAENEESKYKVKERDISFHVIKKEEKSWERLLENKQLQKTNVKIDFGKWVDSDEEDESSKFNVDGMQGVGGPGGPGGPGGMPGMPGMPGMGGMPGGMGGMGGMPGMEGMDMAKMMEQMKNMKGGAGEDDDDEDDYDSDDLPDIQDDDDEEEEGDAKENEVPAVPESGKEETAKASE